MSAWRLNRSAAISSGSRFSIWPMMIEATALATIERGDGGVGEARRGSIRSSRCETLRRPRETSVKLSWLDMKNRLSSSAEGGAGFVSSALEARAGPSAAVVWNCRIIAQKVF